MSSKLHGLVWEGCAHAGLILSRVAVMARLADYSNDEGLSWPAVETIQRQIGAKSKTTVSAAIDELARDGWLTKTARKSGGRDLSNVYQINVDKLEEAAAAARMGNKSKKRSERVTPPNIAPPTVEGLTVDPPSIDPPTVEGLTVDPPNIDPPIVEGSTIGKTPPVEGSMVDPDPSVKTDPSVKRSSCPDAAQPDEPDSDHDFLSRHPEAVVFSAKKRLWGRQEDLTCAEWIWGRILRLHEQAAEYDGEIVRPKAPNWIAWANEVRLMCELDGRTHRQICELFGRVNRDPFWCRNVLSPAKLREKWDELVIRLGAPGAGVQDRSLKTLLGAEWNTEQGWEDVL